MQKHTYDQKNIRRRVYDALNVLMAMNIIAKDKKVIKWLGIPECYKQSNKDENVMATEQENEASRQLLLKQIEQEEVNLNLQTCLIFVLTLYYLATSKRADKLISRITRGCKQ